MGQLIGKKMYEESEELAQKALDVIENEEAGTLELGSSVIRYMKVYPEISKRVAGRCIRATRELKYFSDCDYIIEMSGDLWDALDEKVQYILMLHELMHIYVDYDDNGDPKFQMRDHDVMDFKYIIEQYGIEWLTNIQDTVNSLIPENKQRVTSIQL